MTETGMPSEDLPVACSDDAFVGGALRILQPREGARAGIDPVFLAAAVGAEAGQRILEPGSGVGVAGLCLARRVPGIFVVGLELQPELAAIAARNVCRNGLQDRLGILCGDIGAPALTPAGFDQVMMNPPFYDQPDKVRPARAPKALSHMGDGRSLADWLAFGLKMLKPKGTLILIHRPDRLADILAALAGKAGAIRVFPLWPDPIRPAKRVLIKAVKGSKAPLSLLPGLVLHAGEKTYSREAEAVLRRGEACPF